MLRLAGGIPFPVHFNYEDLPMKANNKTKSAPVAAAVAAVLKPDAQLATDAHKGDRAKALTAIDTATDLLGGAMVNGLRMTAQYGQTSTEEVAQYFTRCNSPKVYASWFNRGAKAASIIGEAATLELIDKVDANGKGGFTKARDALGSIIAQAKDAGAKTLAPKAAKAAVTFAAKAAVDKSAVRKSKPVTVVRKRSDVTMAAAALECGRDHKAMAGFLKLAANQGSKMPEREGREALHREAVAMLQSACELWQQLAK